MIRGVRGATTVQENKEEEIVKATEQLLREIVKRNEIKPEDVASVFVSVTEDINATFPSKALRLLDGWTFVPVMCMQEIPVPDSLKKCIRVMIHLNTNKRQTDIKHVYLNDAVVLRPDLTKNDENEKK